jgi:hypothetical protein
MFLWLFFFNIEHCYFFIFYFNKLLMHLIELYKLLALDLGVKHDLRVLSIGIIVGSLILD